MFIQTWNEDKGSKNYNPKRADYPVFLATSQQSGKDNGGEYVYRYGADNAPLLNSKGQRVIEHDLDAIADKFKNWGAEQGFAFCSDES
jgi:type I restriction enzyme M protein